MPATLCNLLIEKGATFAFVATWLDENDAPIDVSGYSARMQVRPKSGGPLVVELTSDTGRIVLGGTEGTATLLLPASVTTTLPAGTYVYKLELVQGAVVYRLIEGAVEISP